MIQDFFYFESVYYFETSNFLNFVNGLEFSLNFSLNALSSGFSILVLLIGFTTNIYTLNYFKGEADEGKFCFFINAFILSMLILIYANNFYTLFLGWELIGLTSFFLINFWNYKRSTLKASLKAFSFNLVSDVFLLVSFVCFYQASGTTDCDTFYYVVLWEGLWDFNLFSLGLVFLCLCASIKSVQIVGHLWLPDSMEAPVPASSLIHSATLVSAGIYLLCKFNYLITLVDWTNFLVSIGALTAAYGGVTAASQTDMKKLLAYSTMSHCGFLWITACSGDLYITLTYLFLHGIFKASTFYCAGSFIRIYATQDTRWMGSGAVYLPNDSVLLIICSSNLAGLPFTIGFLYKFFFLKLFILGVFNLFSIGFITIGMVSSVVYFFRLVNYSVFDFYKNVKHQPFRAVELNKNKTVDILNFTPLNHVFSVLFLVASGFFVYTVSYMYIILDLDILGFFDLIDYTFLKTNSVYTLYNNYMILFYFIYSFVSFLLIFISYRANIFKREVIFFCVFFFIFFFFLF